LFIFSAIDFFLPMIDNQQYFYRHECNFIV
jgi:hypothetical protein